MSTYDHPQTSSPHSHTHPHEHDDEGKPTPPRRPKLDNFTLDPGVIEELTGRAKARFRGLTPIRGLSGDVLDHTVQIALAKLRDKYGKGIDAKRKKLAQKYLDTAEAVTARLNRQALSRTTRVLLATEGVYETLLLKAIEEGVGQHSEGPEAAGDSHADKKQPPAGV